ncbi:MAG: metallophosphoesterase family protein [Candidatus Parcubacteria bacterium]|nr:metallophosphoesterase family protein [Candidatus Parcubacteria bacterium]
MKILVVGDPHGVIPRKIPKKIDLILITGDIGKADLARKIAFENIERRKRGLPKLKKDKQLNKKIKAEINSSTLKVLNYLSKFAPVYTITGNVGIPNSKKFNKKVKLVKNQYRNIHKLRVGFLEYFVDNSWIKEFGEKDKKRIKKAQKETIKAKKVLERFGNLDILLCHQPPFGYLDKVNFPGAPAHWKGKHAGSKIILDYIKKEQPRYVFCGHIHEAKGKTKIGKTEVYNVGSNGDYVLLNID